MPVNPDFVFDHAQISDTLLKNLNLPGDVWSMVLTPALDRAYVLDTAFSMREHRITGDVREAVQSAISEKPAVPRARLPYRHYECI